MNDIAKRLAELSPEKRALVLKKLREKNVAESRAANAQEAPLTAVPREQAHPLSFAQEQLWFLSQMDGGNASYNMPAALRLTGPLRTELLTQSFNALIARHETLRTTFHLEGGRPAQKIVPAFPLSLPVKDLSTISPAAQAEEVQRIAREQAQQPFHLSTGPLLRATLLRLHEDEHVLVLVMHHIISDGWSMGVLVQEIARVYDALCKGIPSPLPALPIQYVDFVHWQRARQREDALAKQLAYWKQQFSGELPVVDFPTDRPRPAQQTFRGATRSFAISSALTESLRVLSQREGATLFMTLMAAFNVLLFRYTGQEDLVVGFPVANRLRSEFEGLIGLFVNTLALRTDISGNPSFRDLVQRVKAATLAAHTNQEAAFEQVVQAIQPVRDLSRHPVFQMMFVLQNAPMPTLQLSGLALEPLELSNDTARFDLSLVLTETPEGLSGLVEYTSDLFDEATIARLIGHYETLLNSIATQPDLPVSSLSYLTEAERAQILVEWNDTAADFPQDRCIHELFEEQAARTPEATAIVFEEQTLTYRDVNQRANQLAQYLRTLHVQPETLVGICIDRSPEMIIGILGILKAGGAYLPLDPAYPPERLRYMLADSRVSLLLTREAVRESLPEHEARVLCLDSEWDRIGRERSENIASGVTPDNLAYVIYTSGSTGRPKGTLLMHRGLCNVSEAQVQMFELAPSDTVLQFSSLSFDAATFEIVMALRAGATLCLARRETLLPGPSLIALLQRHQVSVVTLPPSALASLPAAELPALRVINVAGEACSADLVARWAIGRSFFNLYGPTEATIWVSAARCVRKDTQPPIGRPIQNIRLYILDQYRQPVPVGVSGELHIGGVGLARGYLNLPETTAEKFIANPFTSDPADRLYKTGDLARYLPDGTIEFLGRIDHQVKLRGFRIELGEIEALLTDHPAVNEALVLVREGGQSTDKRLVAYVVPTPGMSLEYQELRQYLKARVPDYMVPSAFVTLDAFPLTPNGKIDRRALPAPETGRALASEAFIAPETATEKLLAEIWAEVLQVDRVGIHDNFFELGGHSLLIPQLQSVFQDRAGQSLSPIDIFQYPTVHALATHLTEQEPPQDVSSAASRAQKRRTQASAIKRQRQTRQKRRTSNTQGEHNDE